MITHIAAISFSPTGQTEALVREFGEQLVRRFQAEGVPLSHHSFTLPQDQQTLHTFGPATLVIFGMPTYAGRIPNKALPFVQQLFSGDPENKTPAVALVTFGNRSYDSSLTELRDELEKKDFRVFAAGAFAAPHAFAAIGRDHPTVQDKEKFQELLDRVEGKLRSGEPLERVSINGDAPVAPYYIPLGEDGQPAKFLKAKPQTDLTKCDHCGKCAQSGNQSHRRTFYQNRYRNNHPYPYQKPFDNLYHSLHRPIPKCGTTRIDTPKDRNLRIDRENEDSEQINPANFFDNP